MSLENFKKPENILEKDIENQRNLANSRLQSINDQLRLADSDASVRENLDLCVKSAIIPAIGALIFGLIAENVAPGTGGKEYGEVLTTLFAGMAGASLGLGSVQAILHKIKRFIQGQPTYSEHDRNMLNAAKVNVLYPND